MEMDFERFKNKVIFLGETEEREIRKKYIEKFIDVRSDTYQKYIKKLHKFKDGYCYLGYLWDCIISATVVDEEYINQSIKKDEQVYVFWDIHSCERIFIQNYWRFEKDAVLQMSLKLLLENEDFLPDDIYIVDKDFMWTLIKTHEDIDGKRYCLKCGNI